MKRKVKNSNDMILEAQKALEAIKNKEASKGEGAVMMRLIKVMNDAARIKLQYNIYQSDHSKIEYLEDN